LAKGHGCHGNLDVGDEVWKSVPEVSVVPEDMVGKKWRNDWTTGSRIEHEDQNAHIYTHTHTHTHTHSTVILFNNETKTEPTKVKEQVEK